MVLRARITEITVRYNSGVTLKSRGAPIVPKQRNENGDTEAFVSTTSELREAELEKATGGSRSTGSGAGKVTHHDLSITHKTDKSSSNLF
jgi:hypothetical protein